MSPKQFPPTPQDHARRRAVFGGIVAVIGILLLLHMLNVLPPLVLSFHFGWPLILIAIGIIIGLKSGFRNHAWWILILLGGVHFIPSFEINGVPSRRIIWPSMLIVAGLLIVLRRNHFHHFNRRRRRAWDNSNYPGADAVVTNDNDMVDVDVLFSGRKEIVTSRNFRGGHVSASFSGVELNLARADATAPMMLDIRVSFASVELIVPAHWEIQNEIMPTMGSVEDERRIITPDNGAGKKLLILRGTCTFGSVEIKSY